MNRVPALALLIAIFFAAESPPASAPRTPTPADAPPTNSASAFSSKVSSPRPSSKPTAAVSRSDESEAAHARQVLLQETILALDAGCTLAELESAIRELYPDLAPILDQVLHAGGHNTLQRAAWLNRINILLVERLVFDAANVDCGCCRRIRHAESSREFLGLSASSIQGILQSPSLAASTEADT